MFISWRSWYTILDVFGSRYIVLQTALPALVPLEQVSIDLWL
jgi:hypothetical protein